MLMLLLLLAAGLLLAMQSLRIRLDLHHHGQTRLCVEVRALCFRRTTEALLVSTAHGHRFVPVDAASAANAAAPGDSAETAADAVPSAVTRALRTLLSKAKARQFLLRRTVLQRLDALLCLRLQDAARCALLTGSLQGATAFLPPAWRERVHLRTVPDFYRDHTTLQVRCILRLRLGTLMAAALLLVLPAGAKKEV